MNVGAILIVAAVALGQPTPSHTGGTITYTGADITCKQVEAFMKRMAKESRGKIKPRPCHQNAAAVPKNSN